MSLRAALVALLAVGAAPLCPADAHEFHTSEVVAPLPAAGRMVPAAGTGLFAQNSTVAPQSAGRGRFIKRWRMARFDPAYRDRMIAAAPVPDGAPASQTGAVDTFKLALFGDVSVTLYKTGMRQDSLGSTIWTGRVVDAAGGEALLVFRNGQIGGTVRVGKKTFTIEPTGTASAKIVETDPDLRPHIDPLPVPGLSPTPALDMSSSTGSGTPAAPPIAADQSTTVINILVAYTPAAAAAISDIQSAISMGISYTNQVMTNSGLNIQMNLVGVMEVNYAENGAGADTIIATEQAGTGPFAAVQAQRSALKADLVSVWGMFTDACGVAYQLDNADQYPTAEVAPYGYNAISTSFGYGCLTDAVAHEIGHNLGAAHDRYIDDPTDQLTTRYNFGYVDIPDQIRTIMSYPNACTDIGLSCEILPYHSSPNLTYQGHPLGIADSLPTAADNVRRIREIAPYIALFESGGGTTHTLQVVESGSGSGTVTSSPVGISCGTTCSSTFAAGSAVTLTATPTNGSTFTGWSGGGCTDTSTCTVTMSTDQTVTANFTTVHVSYTLSLEFSGLAGGTVTSQLPGGVSGSVYCQSNCSRDFAAGTSITLIASPAAGAIFAGWGGACSGTGTCTLAVNANETVVANFAPAPVPTRLSIDEFGTGSGTVTSNPAGLSCGATCTAYFPAGTVITLTPTPGAGSIIFGWGGGPCSGTAPCTFTLLADTTASINFKLLGQNTLSVALSGGPGSIRDGVGQIACGYPADLDPGEDGTECSASYDAGSTVELYTRADPTDLFVGWSDGSCSSTDQNGQFYFCFVTLDTDKTVTANYRLLSTYDELDVLTSGAGSGSVQASSGYCYSLPCKLYENPGTQVTLTAAPGATSLFTGWSGGGCSGTGSCIVTMSSALSVTANFAVDPASLFTLNVVKAGSGSGTVTTNLNPSGIACGVICSGIFSKNTNIQVIASAAQGSVFAGWSGAGCSGSLFVCFVNANADTTLTAIFSLLPTTNMLSVVKFGGGGGTITSSPPGIVCGSTCNASFASGSSIRLTASSDSGSIFSGWSGGGCGTSPVCVVSPTYDTVIAANFSPIATAIGLNAAILPSSRSVQVGSLATLFGTMINSGPGTATACTIAPAGSVPADFTFQTTNPTSNALTGTPNTPVDIPQGSAQSFLLAFTPDAAFNPMDVAFSFSCSNADAAATYSGVNTLLLSASMTPVPDIVAISGTLSSDGTLHIPGASAAGAFVVAISNVGSAAQIFASADTGTANLPLTLTVCQTNPATGACLAPPAASVPSQIGGQTTASYAVFAQATGTVPFLPAANRVYVRFMDSAGLVRGSTSVAVTTE